MSIDIRYCKPDELPILIARLDSDFITAKQRSLSLSKRFPNTLSIENLENIHVAVSDDGICGAYSVRMFDWIVDGDVWRGAMVGMVWVSPPLRRQGIGRLLMDDAIHHLREKKVDFGVLWTGSQPFYERAGWFQSDCGLLGEAQSFNVPLCDNTVSCRALACMDTAWLESVRSRFKAQFVARKPLDYRTVPIPAINVSCFVIEGGQGREGFALVGEHDGTAYFYEMAAPFALWDPLWNTIVGRFDRIFVNGRLGDPFSEWLLEEGHVVWHPQNKTMWLRLSDRSVNISLTAWHIPYFDWI